MVYLRAVIHSFTYPNRRLVEKALAGLDGIVTTGYFRAVIYSFTYPNRRLVEKALAEPGGVVTAG
jgi:hypothetical protein